MPYFEEFSVFDCQMKPKPTDKTGVGRIAYYTYDKYLDKFGEIYDIFSKEASTGTQNQQRARRALRKWTVSF